MELRSGNLNLYSELEKQFTRKKPVNYTKTKGNV